jgi:hypothetical protein
LISEWVSLTRTSPALEPMRGYDARHSQGDIDRERAHQEARAAAALAMQYIDGDTAPIGA